nr:MAG TPA: apocytochrome F [Caudoviricetes sp.]
MHYYCWFSYFGFLLLLFLQVVCCFIPFTCFMRL